MAARTPKTSKKGSGFDMTGRQARNRRNEKNEAERVRDNERRDAEVSSYLGALAERYKERDVTEGNAKTKPKGSGRPRAIPMFGGIRREAVAGANSDIRYRSNEEALPSRHYTGRGRGRGRGRGDGSNRKSRGPQPAYDATEAAFGPSLGASRPPPLPKIWGPGMNPPKPKTVTKPAPDEAIPQPPANSPAPAPAPGAGPISEADVWGEEDDSDDEADITPLQPGQAWGDAA